MEEKRGILGLRGGVKATSLTGAREGYQADIRDPNACSANRLQIVPRAGWRKRGAQALGQEWRTGCGREASENGRSENNGTKECREKRIRRIANAV